MPFRRRVRAAGLVQGVGFRPYVYALARELGLTGWVRNTSGGVIAEVEGDAFGVAEFCRRLGGEAPALATVTDVDWCDVSVRGDADFVIEASHPGHGHTLVPADVAICDDCLRELNDPDDRRYRHPFVSCVNCGPRFTIIRALPYDRRNTTMAGFALCAECAREYRDPADRRFHAEPICCPNCGPHVSLRGPGGGDLHDGQAIAEARRLISRGAVVAVKGVGGYHLACDATGDAAVALLRQRKHRADKPFAVMVADLATAAAIAELSVGERAALQGRQRPIVLVAKRCDGGGLRLADAVAPGILDVGLLLPYTPLHHLLFGLPGDEPSPQALVMTSGNVSDEPLVTGDDEAVQRLAGLADAWLMHDRPIHRACDDSVVRVLAGTEMPVRRSRGYAPLPIRLPFSVEPTLAVGGDLKNTFCLAAGGHAWMSAHVGDMDDYLTQQSFSSAEHHLESLTGIHPQTLVSDCHPGYRSGRWAASSAAGRPVRRVQHHHAHVAATMAENGHDGSRRVLGVAFDGTGYGDDGAVWGGELLLADYDGYTRAAHLAYVPLPGADAGVRNPCRMALSHLRSAGVDWNERLPCVQACSEQERRLLATQLARGTRCAPTSSMGRLFDAVASIAGLCHRAEHEAQAAARLEAAARCAPAEDDGAYAFALHHGSGFPWDLSAAPVVAAVARDVLNGVAVARIAARFHRAVVAAVVDVADDVRKATGVEEVTLSGGAFVNTLLSGWCLLALESRGFTVLRHRLVPPSDAGLALGQIALGARVRRDDDPGELQWFDPAEECSCV